MARTPDPEEHWLWCMMCERFFHMSRVWFDAGGAPRCPFLDCRGMGFDLELFFWDSVREPEDPRWPSDVGELRHGMRSPEMEPFYEARREERIAAVLASFEGSEERRELGGGAVRYVRPFLTMMADLCWDLTDPEDVFSFDEETERLVLPDLPVWARTADVSEAPRMLAELRALFAFAERTGALSDAAAWRKLLSDDGLVSRFEHSMRTNRRLRPRGGGRARRRRNRRTRSARTRR